MLVPFFMDLSSLTASQKRAVTHGQGPVIVGAGPGTGKTRTLVYRIAWLIEQAIAAPEEILAVTFTQKAAEEMRLRIEGLKGKDLGPLGPQVATFHGLCLRLLKEHLSPPFRLLSEPQVLTLLRDTVRESLPDFPMRRLKELARRISLAKNHLLSPESAAEAFPQEDFPSWTDGYKAYQSQLSLRGLGDFDDLLIRTVTLLERDPALKEKIRSRYPVVLVDEFQDINPAQYRLFQFLTRNGGDWMVIGDPNQSIYGFRGSHPDFFLTLKEAYPEAEWISLEETFRLNDTVLTAASRVLKDRSQPLLRARKSGPPSIPVIGLADEEAEAEYIAGVIEREVGGLSFLSTEVQEGGGTAGPRGLADIAVLYRLHAQGDPLAEVFARKGIPFQRVQEIHWAERPEVRTLLKKMLEFRGRNLSPQAAFNQALDQGKEPFFAEGEGAEILNRLHQMAASFPGNLEEFVEDLSLLTGLDTFEPAKEAVSLLTLHAAKGLEFPLVIISGCEDTLLPLSLLKESDPEEERRLFYVALTRAQDQVILTWAGKRTLLGKRLKQKRSPFVEDIGPALLKEVTILREEGRRRPRSRQLSLFDR